ncbi:hypothetical protein L226DRAFT_569102 [Lentinus tigrinus ALCF2SS1-7]|uniref:uncharacterized protein n=1 Tax=Lentinus tigrinus ALCF2SS1-7 TaxID=1328758 RepID=UPI0011663B29|nr:hypothetical protein L226DRAFT_569102 [Lentinus tigrinus ALCF2SS1-7]
MSSDDLDGFTPTDILQIYAGAWVPQVNYLAVGSVALIVYEHLLTVMQEYRVIWQRKISVPMVLFIINRYGLLAFGIIYLLSTFLWWRDDLVRYPFSSRMATGPGLTCEIFGRLQIAFIVILDLVHVVFSSLRIHAINNRNWWWTTGIFTLGFIATSFNIADLIMASFGTGNPIIEGCFASVGLFGSSPDSWYRISLDVVVLGITWYRTAGIVKAARSVNVDTSVVSVLLRDGTTYFFMTLAINIAGIVTLVAGLNSLSVEASVQVFLSVQWTSPETLMPHSLNAVTMSRFILNLRVASSHAGGASRTLSTLPPQVSDIDFSSSVLGNIGASVEFTGDSDCDDDDNE